MKKDESTFRTELVEITPDVAKEMLRKNKDNRKITQAASAFLVKQMEQGKWRFTADPIQFSDKGRLIDGQHRLDAIVKSGKAQTMLVAYNVPDDHQNVIDTGKNRSAGDVLYMHGIQNHTIAAALIKTYMRFSRNITSYGGDKKHVASNEDVLKAYKERPKFFASATLEAQAYYKNSNQLLPASKIGGLYVLLLDKAAGGKYNAQVARTESDKEREKREAKGDHNRVKEFFDKLFLGVGLDVNSTVYVFRKQLTHARMNGFKIPDKDFFAMFIMTWNDFVEGKFRKKVVAPKSGKIPGMAVLDSQEKLEFNEDKVETEEDKSVVA